MPVKVKHVAVDVGFSSVKAVDGEGHSVHFPSHLAPYVSRGGLHRDDALIVTVDGRPWRTGADNSGGNIHSGAGDFHGSDEWRVLMARTFYELGRQAGAGPLLTVECLGVGLPYAYWTEANSARLASHTRFEFEAGGEPWKVEVGSVQVFAQGLSICATLPDDQMPESAGFVDIGHYTLDLLGMVNHQIPEGRCDSYALGAFQIYSDLRSRFMARPETQGMLTLSDAQIGRILRDKFIKFRGARLDLAGEVETTLRENYAAMESKLLQLWGDDLPFFDAIFIGGGGALLMKSVLPTSIQGIPLKILENAVFGNALAYLAAIKS